MRRAQLRTPPVLVSQLPESGHPYGEWVSERCESRNEGAFVTRRLLFESDARTWHGFYYYYNDAM